MDRSENRAEAERKYATLVVQVDGRDALPVRAIPYVTGWSISPDVVARDFAREGGPFQRMENTHTFHLVEGVPVKLLPKEWDRFVAAVKGLEAELGEQFTNDDVGYAAWISQSVARLPAGVFVWLDEFVADFEHDYGPERLSMMDERDGDRTLNLSPFLEDQVLNMALEGFERRRPIGNYSSEDSISGVVEYLQNDKLIDWNYWVGNMPTLSPAEAARLMEALDPELYEDLNSRPVAKYDSSKACGAARRMERLAAAEGRGRMTPEEWYRWAMERDFSVHRGFYLAGLGRYLQENEEHVLASMAQPEARRWREAHPVGNDTRQVSTDFCGCVSSVCVTFPEFCAEVEERLARWRRGRYKLVEAAQVIADSGADIEAVVLAEQMEAAVHSEKLIFRVNSIRAPARFIPQTRLSFRDLFEEDVNAWLKAEAIGEDVKLEFPYPDVPEVKKGSAGPSDGVDYSVLASREQLVAAFGSFTGMDMEWFKNLKDTPALLAARKVQGQGGRGHIAQPFFCPFEVMQWLADAKRRKGRRLSVEKGWALLEAHFPKVYAAHSVGDPRDGD